MLHILRTLSQFLWMPAFVIAFIYQRKAINKTKAFSVKHSIDFMPNFLGLPRADEIKHMHMNAKTENIKKDIEKVMSRHSLDAVIYIPRVFVVAFANTCSAEIYLSSALMRLVSQI